MARFAGASPRTAHTIGVVTDVGVGLGGSFAVGALSRVPAGAGQLVHLTSAENAAAIRAQQSLGLGSTIYAGPKSLANARGWSIFLRWTSFDDRGAARRSVDALLGHTFDGSSVGHGAPIESDAREVLARRRTEPGNALAQRHQSRSSSCVMAPRSNLLRLMVTGVAQSGVVVP